MERSWFGVSLLVLAGVALWVLGGGASDVPSTVTTAAQTTSDAIGQTLGRLQSELLSKASGKEDVPVRKPPASAPGIRRRPATHEQPVDRSVVAASPIEVPPSAPRITEERALGGEDAATAADVYSADDVDVVPPALRSIHRQSAASGESPGGPNTVLELVVNEAGRVESVRTPDAPPTLSEYVMAVNGLSAAKTWLFRPATRRGVAVKYRLRMMLDGPPQASPGAVAANQ